MRVAHIVLSLDVGGLERGVINQVREGQKLGQQVSIICLERPGSLAAEIERLGVPLVSLNKPPGLRLGIVRDMRAALKQLRPDVVHTHQIGTLFYAGPVARCLRVPVVVHTEHGRENYAGRLRTRLLGRMAAIFASRFYCLTEDMAAHVRRHRITRASKVRVIENGIDTDLYMSPFDTAGLRQQLNIPEDALVIGTVGRLSEVKHQEMLIQAFANLRARHPDTHLLLVGDGPLRDELKAQATKCGMADLVHFAGYQPMSGPYLRIMDVFALTSRSEGMPQAALEASVVGLPVVASRVGGLPELIVDGMTGFLFDHADVDALGERLSELLGAPDRRRAMGMAARARVESRFHVRRMASDYHRHFLEFLGRDPLPNQVC